jgi:uncharacterized surface protein with fasciclin (FAS1) repeats
MTFRSSLLEKGKKNASLRAFVAVSLVFRLSLCLSLCLFLNRTKRGFETMPSHLPVLLNFLITVAIGATPSFAQQLQRFQNAQNVFFSCETKNIDVWIDALQYEETNDAHDFSIFRALLLATMGLNCVEKSGQSYGTIFAPTNLAFEKYALRYATSISSVFEDEYLLCELAKRHRFVKKIRSKDFIDGRSFEEWEGTQHRKRCDVRVVNRENQKREIYVMDAKVVSSYSTCNDTVIVHAIGDLLVDFFNDEDVLATYNLPSLYDFLGNSVFAEDISITLQALYVAFGNVKIFQNAGSARTMLIPTNDAWRKLFAETSLTKAMLFNKNDESNNQDQLKNIVLRFLVSSFQQLRASSGAMKAFAQSYGGDDFILVEDIRTSDGLLLIVSRLPLLEMRVEKSPMSKFFDPVFLLQKNARVSLYTNLLHSESQIIDFLQQELPAISSSNTNGVVKTRSVIGVLVPTNVAFRSALRYLNVQNLLAPLNIFNATGDERALLKLITQQIITYNTFRILEPDAMVLEAAARDVMAEIDFDSLDSYLSYPMLRRPGNVFVGNPIAKKLRITKRKGENAVKVRGMLNSAKILQIFSSSNGMLIITDELLSPPTAELGLSLLDRLQRIPFSFVYQTLLAYLGLTAELRSGWSDAILLIAHDLPMISTLTGIDVNYTASSYATNGVNTSASFFIDSDNENMVDEALYDIVMRNIWHSHQHRNQQRGANLYHESYVSLDVHNLDENVNCFQTLNDATGSNTCNRFNRDDVFDANAEYVERNAYVEVLDKGNTTQMRQIIGEPQLALNGEVHIISSLLVPDLYGRCSRLPDFSINITENDTSSQTFTINELYEKAKKRFSVETVIKSFKRQISANSTTSLEMVDVFACDPWCLGPTTWIFCKPCRGEQFQVIFSIGGFAPYQSGGGAMILAVSDTNELYFGVSPYVATFNLESSDAGGGLRLIDARVKAIGVSMPREKPIRVLTTYDGYANITKIYVNGKFRGVGSLDGFQFDRFKNDDTPPSLRIGTLGVAKTNASSSVISEKEPALFKLFPRLQSNYDNDLHNMYLNYAGDIDSINVWFDHVKYPSTCYNS